MTGRAESLSEAPRQRYLLSANAARPRSLALSLGGSFRSKVAGVAVVTTIAALLAAFTLLLFQGWSTERVQLVRARGAVAQELGYNLAASLVFRDEGGAKVALESVRNIPDVRSAFVFDKEGRLFAQMGEKTQDIRPDVNPAARTPTWRYTARALDYRFPVIVDHERVGELVLVSSLDQLWTLLRGYLVVACLSFAAATGIAVVTGLWLARIIIEPVSRLAQAMNRVRRSGEFEHAVERTSEDEVGHLTDAFNDLLGELKRNDHSLREAFEDLTVARDHAQDANVQKSQFLANMSHEIRTPLNGILGMAQAMQMDALSTLQAGRLAVIRSSGEVLLTVLNDILDISKIEAGKLELETVDFDIGVVVESVRAIFAPAAGEKDVALTIRMDATAEGAWTGDPTRLRQILSNLISNGLKFTSAGSVTVDIAADAHGLHLRVQDTGIGVPPEKRAQLFGKFVQADSSTTRRFGGTGLGLAICRELATLMGGRIELEDTGGPGASFLVDLPLQRAAEPDKGPGPQDEGSAPIASEGGGRALRILAADDNATNRLVLGALLSSLDVELTLVEDGRSAVEAWRRSTFDLILMDIQMPIMDGVQATTVIRADEARAGQAPTPIFALSANAMTHQIDGYLAAGMSGHISKPIDAAKLFEAIGALELTEAAA